MSEELPKLHPVPAFSNMFKQHLEKSGYNLSITNMVLFRNVLKEGIKEGHLDSDDETTLRQIEEQWEALNKGCGCTRAKRQVAVEESTQSFANSDKGKAMFGKIKTGFGLNSIQINVPSSNGQSIKCDF
tara:strand:+ start:1178 stop:1564 length:387 start_codon:yes stop_codon:yes gene_type:complete